MKKFLLSLFGVAAMAFAANAETATFDFTKIEGFDKWGSSYAKHEVVYDEATIVFDSANKQSSTITDMPVTKGLPVTVTLKEGTLNSITFKFKQWTNKAQTATLNLSTDGTEFTATETTSADFTLTGTDLPAGTVAAKVTFSSTANQIGIESVTIEYTVGDPSDERESAGLSFEKSKVTIYADEKDSFEAPALVNPNELTVTYATSNDEVAEVDAATGAVTLSGEPGEATITATFAGNETYREGKASYTIVVKDALPEVKTVVETIALEKDTEAKVAYALTVGFVNNSNIFACDEAGKFIQVYGANSYKVGDVIPAGWAAKYTLYSNVTPELVPIDALPEATEGTFTPKAVAAADITTELVNSVVVVKDVVIAEATPGADVTESDKKNFTGTVDEVTLNFRNNYKVESVEAGTYDITVVVTIFNNNPSLYVISFAKPDSSAIAEIEAAEAPAVYYNLQGVQVANPANGIYVRVAAGKASKVLVK